MVKEKMVLAPPLKVCWSIWIVVRGRFLTRWISFDLCSQLFEGLFVACRLQAPFLRQPFWKLLPSKMHHFEVFMSLGYVTMQPVSIVPNRAGTPAPWERIFLLTVEHLVPILPENIFPIFSANYFARICSVFNSTDKEPAEIRENWRTREVGYSETFESVVLFST